MNATKTPENAYAILEESVYGWYSPCTGEGAQGWQIKPENWATAIDEAIELAKEYGLKWTISREQYPALTIYAPNGYPDEFISINPGEHMAR